MKCTVCDALVWEFGSAEYMISEEKSISTPVLYCQNCDTFIRQVEKQAIEAHLQIATYTDSSNEQSLWKERIAYFQYLFSLVKSYKHNPSSWLDFGCAYGHLLEYVQKENIIGVGIEVAPAMLDSGRNKGLRMYEEMGNLAEDEQFDVISAIDSLYYHSHPQLLIRAMYQKLNKEGILIVRITNRNAIIKLKKKILKKEVGFALGDAIVGYSAKSIVYLLEQNGFSILKITSKEKGKALTFTLKMFYLLTNIIDSLSGGYWNFSPGIIVIAQKK